MRPSLARYFAVLVPLTFLINVVINTVAGLVLFPAGHAVPLHGAVSIDADTTANSFIIGLLTIVTVLPGARREAWAGRVRGFGLPSLTWPNKHPWIFGIGVGLLASIALAQPALFYLAHHGIESMTRHDFVVFKAGFSGALGVVVAIIGALAAIGVEPDVTGDSRWCRDTKAPTGGANYPCDYFDKGALAVTDNARGCSGTPTWQLLVSGVLDPSHVRTALSDVVTRYPSLSTKVQGIDGVPPWASRYRYAHDPSFKVDDIFRVADVRGKPDRLAELSREEANRPLDPFADYPVTLTMAVVADESCRFYFRQHHAIADGRAFIGLLEDFANYLNAARSNRRPSADELAPVHRHGDLEPLALTPTRVVGDTLTGLGSLLGKLLRNTFRPLTPLMQNFNRDYSGENGTIHWIVPDTVLDGWNAARKKSNVSLNSLLTGVLFMANARWHRSMNQPLGRTVATLMVETRPRDGKFVSFANHLAMHEISLRLDRVEDAVDAMKQVDAEVRSQRDAGVPIKRLLAERLGVLLLPLGDMRKIVFESKQLTSNVDFSNLIALSFPTLQGEGWKVEEVHITTTVTPMKGIILTVIRYNGRLTFNFNYKASAATREQTKRLAEEFVAVLEETTGVQVTGEWV